MSRAPADSCDAPRTRKTFACPGAVSGEDRPSGNPNICCQYSRATQLAIGCQLQTQLRNYRFVRRSLGRSDVLTFAREEVS